MDPSDLNTLSLAIVLTAGGATVSAALITGLIGMLKKLPSIGPAIDANREPAVAYILSAILVVVAFTQLPEDARTVASGFGAFLAWYGIAQIAGAVHDTVKDVTSGTERVITREPKSP